jgi:hypothetical protein
MADTLPVAVNQAPRFLLEGPKPAPEQALTEGTSHRQRLLLKAVTDRTEAFKHVDDKALNNQLNKQADQKIFDKNGQTIVNEQRADDQRAQDIAADETQKLQQQDIVRQQRQLSDLRQSDVSFQQDVISRRLDRAQRDQVNAQRQVIARQVADQRIATAPFNPDAPRGSIVDLQA